MKHFFSGVIAQDICKIKSEKIELFKNTLNKLLNIKNHFILKVLLYYITPSKFAAKLRMRSVVIEIRKSQVLASHRFA